MSVSPLGGILHCQGNFLVWGDAYALDLFVLRATHFLDGDLHAADRQPRIQPCGTIVNSR